MAPAPELSVPADLAAGRRRGPVAMGPSVPGEVLLARLFTVESGVDHPIDRAIMVHVLDDRRAAMSEFWGRPVSLLEAAERYSRDRLRRAPRDAPERIRWILAMDGTGRKPSSFPDRLRWSTQRDGFAALVIEARGYLSGERPPDPCRGAAGYWGGSRGLELTSDQPRGSMRRIVCHRDQILRTYSTARTRRRRPS